MTTAERFERVRSLFVAASDLPQQSRPAWLESQCADDHELMREVEDLLERMEKTGGVNTAAGVVAAQSALSDALRSGATRAIPRRIGGYEILHAIGSGGMGTVYAAEQAHPRRRVALKLLREGNWSEQARRRFEYEAELLGRLRHPGIAHIYEAGVADFGLGLQPFLAMELVEGEPLAEWVAASTRSLQTKLELFIELCLAVQHAHERGVIHRDLKPDNILVEQHGSPKVLDFGIARAIGADVGLATRLTEAGAIVGTLPYMSPERLADDPDAIDTRSDVYSLGVILHELVSGRRPHAIEGLAIGRAIEMIRFEDPAPLRADSSVGRDLEIIIEKSIDKDPARRYASAAALADDVQRYLRDEAISARPASTFYQVRKLVRRHRAFAMGAAAVLVMLVLGLCGTMWQARRAEARRQEAEREKSIAQEEKANADKNAAETKLVADFQSGILSDLSVDEFGRSLVVELRKDLAENLARIGRKPEEIEKTLASFDETVRAANPTNVAQRVLEARVFTPAVEKIEKEYGEKRLLAAMLETPLSGTLRNLGLYELGVRAARSAVDSRRSNLGDADMQTVASVHALALLLDAQGKLAEAEPLYREALAACRAKLGDEHPDTINSIDSLASFLRDQGQLAEAEPLIRNVLAARRAKLGDEHPDTLGSINNLAVLLQTQGKLTEAEPLCREALAGRRAKLGDGNPDTLISINNLAALFQAQGKLAEAEPLYREVLARHRAKFGDEHPDTLASINNLAVLLQAEGKFAEAESLHREALVRARIKLGDEHPETLVAINNLSNLLRMQGKLVEAEPLAREALARLRTKLGNEHPNTLGAINNLALLLHTQGKLAEAEPLYREALATYAKLGDDHPETLTLMNNLAALLQAQGKFSESESLFREALASQRAKLGDDHPETLRTINNLASLLRAQGKRSEAETFYREALAGRRVKLGDQHPNTLTTITLLASLLQAQGDLAEAERLYREALDGRRAKLGNGHAETLKSAVSLALVLEARNVFAEAATLMEQSIQLGRDLAGNSETFVRDTQRKLCDLYRAWHKSDPSGGHDRQADELDKLLGSK